MVKYIVLLTRPAELVVVEADNLIDAKNKAIEDYPDADWVSVKKSIQEEN